MLSSPSVCDGTDVFSMPAVSSPSLVPAGGDDDVSMIPPPSLELPVVPPLDGSPSAGQPTIKDNTTPAKIERATSAIPCPTSTGSQTQARGCTLIQAALR